MVILLFSRGKMKRIVFQFTPYSWVKFEWKPASSLRRWLAVCGIIFVVRTPLWPCCPLLPGPATQAAALGMFLKLRPAGIPSQPCRTGAVSLGQVTDSLQKGLSLLAAHCSGNGSNMNWDLWVPSKVLLPRALALGESSSNPSVLCSYRSHYSWKGLYPRPLAPLSSLLKHRSA